MSKIISKPAIITISIVTLLMLSVLGIFTYSKVNNSKSKITNTSNNPNSVSITSSSNNQGVVANSAVQNINWIDGKDGNYTFQNSNTSQDDQRYVNYYSIKPHLGASISNIRPLLNKLVSSGDTQLFVRLNVLIEGQSLFYNYPLDINTQESVDTQLKTFQTGLNNFRDYYKPNVEMEKQEFETTPIMNKESWNLQKINSLNYTANTVESDYDIFQKLDQESINNLVVDSIDLGISDASPINKILENIARTGIKVSLSEINNKENKPLETTVKLKNQDSTIFYQYNSKYTNYLSLLDKDRIKQSENAGQVSSAVEDARAKSASDTEIEELYKQYQLNSNDLQVPLFKDSFDSTLLTKISDQALTNNNRIFPLDPNTETSNNYTPINPTPNTVYSYSKDYVVLGKFARVEPDYLQKQIDNLKTQKLQGEFTYLESISKKRVKMN